MDASQIGKLTAAKCVLTEGRQAGPPLLGLLEIPGLPQSPFRGSFSLIFPISPMAVLLHPPNWDPCTGIDQREEVAFHAGFSRDRAGAKGQSVRNKRSGVKWII